MVILITGVNGFVGQYLTQHLHTNYPNVTVIGFARSSALMAGTNYVHIQQDLTQDDFVALLPNEVDVVVHLANSKQYRNFPAGAADMFAVNVQATFALLEYARKAGAKKFLFTSTGNVYKDKREPLKETDPTLPSSFYGSTKLMAEELVRNYSQLMETAIFRLFGVYGPGQKDMLMANMINKVKNRETVTLASGKGIYINPLLVTDCVQLLCDVIFSNHKLPPVLNLAGDEIVSLDEIITVIEQSIGVPAIRQTNEAPFGYLAGDISLLKTHFPATALTSLETGIHQTIHTEYE
jgi:UDP-glucose 4-epimerase